MNIFPSLSRTAAPTSSAFFNSHFSGLMFFLDMTAVDGSPASVTFKIQLNIPGLGWKDYVTFTFLTLTVTSSILVSRADGQAIADTNIDELIEADLPLGEWRVVGLHTVNASSPVTYRLDALPFK